MQESIDGIYVNVLASGFHRAVCGVVKYNSISYSVFRIETDVDVSPIMLQQHLCGVHTVPLGCVTGE